MITHAQERFEQDYKILRRLVISGDMQGERKLKLWVRERGAQALIAAEREIECSPSLRRLLSRQTKYFMDSLDVKKNGEDDK
jgi:hypothetical protein